MGLFDWLKSFIPESSGTAPLTSGVDATTASNYAMELDRAGRTDEACAIYFHLIQADANNIIAGVNFGDLLLRHKQADAAVTLLKVMVDRAPDFDAAWINLSAALSETGDHEQAIIAANRAITVNNSNPYTYYNRAECWAEMQKMDFAIRDYEKALRLAAYDPELTEEISNRLRLARIAIDARLSTFEDAKYEMMGKAHGTWIVDGIEVASTLQCPHCGGHMPSTHDPGLRWFCFHCGDVACEKPECRVCDHYLAKLERAAAESRRLLSEGHPVP